MAEEKFQCDCCGLCCQNVWRSVLSVDLNRGDGVCKNFDEETKLCKIYYSRPIFCNVDEYYEKFLTDKISRRDFHALNYAACKKIKEEFCHD